MAADVAAVPGRAAAPAAHSVVVSVADKLAVTAHLARAVHRLSLTKYTFDPPSAIGSA